MGKVQQPTETVDVKIDVAVSYDETGAPVAATGTKELTEADGGEADRKPDTLSISDDAKTKYTTSIADAKAKYDQAVNDAAKAYSDECAVAEGALDQQLVAENYTNGVFNAPAQA